MSQPAIIVLESENNAIAGIRTHFNEQQTSIYPLRTVERLFDRLTQNSNAFIVISALSYSSEQSDKAEKLITAVIEVNLLYPFSFVVVICDQKLERIFREAGAGHVCHTARDLSELKDLYASHCQSTLKPNRSRLDEIRDELPFKSG